jgi:hypothetical protein
MPDTSSPDAMPDAPPPDTMPPDAGLTTAQLAEALLTITPKACKVRGSDRVYNADGFNDPVDGGVPETVSICRLMGGFYWVAGLRVACDGRNGNMPGKCAFAHDADTQVHQGGRALSATITPYVVIPMSFAGSVREGTVVAVINNLNHQMVFAVFGDVTDEERLGAASWATAERVGITPDPVSGGGLKGSNVTYVVLTGAGSVPANLENQAQVDRIGLTLGIRLIVDNP